MDSQVSSIEERIYDGVRAKEALENESLQWAFDSIEQELKRAWKDSPARDAEGREKIYMMIHMLSKVQMALRTTMETGILATKELEYQRSLKERVKESLRL